MNAIKNLDDLWASMPRGRSDHLVDSASVKLSQVVRSIQASGDAETAKPLDRHSTPEDWQKLIDRVQAAARHSRETDERSLRREEQAQIILFDARKRLDEAADRIYAAEQRADAAEAQAAEVTAAAAERVRAAEDACRAAEERMHAAEERMHAAEASARLAESWLTRVQQAVMAEFADIPHVSAESRPSGSVSHISSGTRRVA